jgi:hypothetical protein
LAAASERVVKPLAAAIDHRVSPGWTVCGTLAPAGDARQADIGMQQRRARKARRMYDLPESTFAGGEEPTP